MNGKFIGCFLVAIAVSTTAAAAEKRDQVKCRTPESFMEQIYNCGRNDLAVHYAAECSDALKKKSRANGAALALVLKELESKLGSGQEASMKDLISRLQISMAALDSQIAELEENTDLVADYTRAMIDFPDGVDDASSAECFNSAFHSLQKIVYDLDDEIINSKNARAKAAALMATAGVRDEKLDRIGTQVEVDARGPSSGTPVKVPAHDPFRSSDISGTEKPKNP